MILKQLELIGFKSFADKTRFSFESGVTGIVGPNGCGKSNVSDAIRWCLGEMSAKSLRSRQMLDVVFNGSAKRSPLNMAEVSLTFDNASRKLPLDFSEITVTRRLYRSGESEYFINRTQCRLKDIRELFLDTGIGAEGYYVMEQGKVEFILSAKPEQRRELFEEAAGVSRYKARREETLQKLNRVEQDMLRLNDSLAIYRQQMESLDNAVKKARQYQKLQEELKSIEIAHLLDTIAQHKDKLAQLEQDREARHLRVSELATQIDQMEASLSNLRLEGTQKEDQYATVQKSYSEAETELAKTEERLKLARERQQELELLAVRLKEEEPQLLQHLEEFAESTQTAEEALTQLEVELEERTASFATAKKADDEARAAWEAIQGKLAQCRNHYLEVTRQKTLARNEISRLSSDLIRSQEQVKFRHKELEKSNERNSGLQTQLNDLNQQKQQVEERIQVKNQALEELRDALTQADQAVAEMDRRQAELQMDLVSAQAHLKTIHAWLEKDPNARGTQAILEQSFPNISGPVHSLFKTGDAYQRLLDVALGAHGDYLVADTLADAQRALNYLKENQKGRATFIILEQLSNMASGSTLAQMPDHHALLEVTQSDPRYAMLAQFLIGKAYFQNQTLYKESVISGGSDGHATHFTINLNEGQRLTQLITKLEGELRALESARNDQAAKKGELVASLRSLSTDHQSERVALGILNESLGRWNEDQDLFTTEQRVLHTEIGQLNETQEQASHALKTEEGRAADLEQKEAAATAEIASIEREQNASNESMRTVHEAFSHAKLELETTRQTHLSRQESLARFKSANEETQKRLELNRQDQVQSEERKQALIQSQKELGDQIAGCHRSKDTLSKQLTLITDERQAIREKVSVEEETLRGLRHAQGEAQTLLSEIQFQLQALNQERDRSLIILQETHHTTIEEATPTYGHLHPALEELNRLRRRLDSMGPVNLAAPEEHAQLEERYSFLLTQQQDLLKAKEDLTSAIKTINATTIEHFNKTYSEVRENFRTLYHQLFQGGEADLVLTQSDNILETGVDIIAQPPGKKLQNITLLSGGEKALTAIALLFAFFMVRPSPFCLLDEVDAPLDEANVARFVEMVRTFAEKTQFITITHNKRTMEMAQILYGVTMEELGVSTLISTRLTKKSTEQAAAEPVPA